MVAWLVVAAVFLTLRMGFINLRAFKHAIAVTRGRYTNPDEPGDVSHFEALSTALSATVGLGNIAGVAIAVSLGGPGATFWMIVAGLLGMSTKFTECTLGQVYRELDAQGHVLGGPMQYLAKGLAERGAAGLGRVLAVLFALLCIGGSFGGGNSFQVNQSMNALQETVPILADNGWAYGLIMTVLVGIVIIGGIRRIASVADKVVPLMAIVYVTGALIVHSHEPVADAGRAGLDRPAGIHPERRLRRLHRRPRGGLPARRLLERGRRRLGSDRPLGGPGPITRSARGSSRYSSPSSTRS